jgi:hypothetical protein
VSLPELHRNRKKNGRYYGSFWVRWDGERCTLDTEDPGLARARRKQVVAGKRFGKPAAVAVSSSTPPPLGRELVDALDQVDGQSQQPTPEMGTGPVPAPGPPAASPPPADVAPRAATPLALPPVEAAKAAGWADDLGAAAAASDAAASSGAPGDGGPTSDGGSRVGFDPAWLENGIKKAAGLAVEAQLWLQEWAARRWGEVELGKVPKDSDAREPGRDLWEGFIRRIMPTDLPIPDWLAAPIAVAMFTLPVQLAGARPISKNPAPVDISPDGQQPPAADAATEAARDAA